MKNYVLLLNDESINFLVNEEVGGEEKLVSLDDVEKWLEKYSEDGIYIVDEDEEYNMMEMMDMLCDGSVDLYNKGLVERGDDYCTLRLLEI